MNLDDLHERTVAAGEWVLGTLDAADHAVFADRLARDAALVKEVYQWQDRLLPLAGSLADAQEAAPPVSVWVEVERRLKFDDPATTAANDPLWRRLRRWQWTGGLAVVASLLMATLLVLRPAPQPPERYLTLLQSPQGQRTGWVVEATAGGRIRLVPLGASEPVPSDRSLQFWTKPQGADRPTSLGLVRAGQVTELPAQRSPTIGADQLFELTLEPSTGSPTGLPTGPILYVGRSVRL
jgi:anti-sigma-K factor RskA